MWFVFSVRKLSIRAIEAPSSILAKRAVQPDNQDCLRPRRSVVQQLSAKNTSYNS